jgi:hypothetical protein
MCEVGLPHCPVEFSSHRHFYKLSCSWLLGICHRSCLLWLSCLFIAYVGSGSSPLSCGVFLPLPLLQAFLLLVAWLVLLLLSSPAGLLWRISPPSLFDAQGAPPSLLRVFFVVIAYYSILFSLLFSGWGSVCPGGCADLAQGCLWEYHVLLSSPCGLSLPKLSLALLSGGGTGAFLISPFNVNWRCYAQAGGVEESKFCLFSVVFPLRCISSVSPRFYFRKHAFCFLPLAAILESLQHGYYYYQTIVKYNVV